MKSIQTAQLNSFGALGCFLGCLIQFDGGENTQMDAPTRVGLMAPKTSQKNTQFGCGSKIGAARSPIGTRKNEQTLRSLGVYMGLLFHPAKWVIRMVQVHNMQAWGGSSSEGKDPTCLKKMCFLGQFVCKLGCA